MEVGITLYGTTTKNTARCRGHYQRRKVLALGDPPEVLIALAPLTVSRSEPELARYLTKKFQQYANNVIFMCAPRVYISTICCYDILMSYLTGADAARQLAIEVDIILV